ncbi:hypothetical protein GCM10023332_00530 [Luteimonas vadosa]|uniref:Polysaccharide biosynthesis protein C-terminal domain-containing protein n=2 Tax=Luteimonas vadosa TaxID=1165507 RepID=A0ABP9DN25_9GAMM
MGSGGLVLRAVIQAIYLLVVSRWLGASDFGLFAGSVAVAAIVAPLANWGTPLLLTRHVARNPESSRAMWATALSQTGRVGGLLSVLVLALAGFVLREHVGLWAMALVVVAELILVPATQAATSQCFALERGMAGSISICLVPAGRVLAAVAMLAAGLDGSPGHAAIAHFVGSLGGLAAALVLVAIVDGWPAWSRRMRTGPATREGTPYAIGGLVGTSYLELDKVLMLQLLGAAIVGPYTAGFRVVGVLVMPIAALIGATLPRLMALHQTSGQARTYRAVLVSAVGYGLLASLATLALSPFVPALFGPGYEDTARYVQWLSPWPLLYALHHSAASALTASDRQGQRIRIESAGLGIAIVLNVVLLPKLGAAGAVVALLATEAVVALMCWKVVSGRKPRQA